MELMKTRTDGLVVQDAVVVAVGRRIASLREEQSITVRQLSKRTELRTTYLTALESGTFSPNTRTLRLIASALGVRPIDLLNHDPNHDAGAIVEMMRRDPDLAKVVRDYAHNRVVN